MQLTAIGSTSDQRNAPKCLKEKSLTWTGLSELHSDHKSNHCLCQHVNPSLSSEEAFLSLGHEENSGNGENKSTCQGVCKCEWGCWMSRRGPLGWEIRARHDASRFPCDASVTEPSFNYCAACHHDGLSGGKEFSKERFCFVGKVNWNVRPKRNDSSFV